MSIDAHRRSSITIVDPIDGHPLVFSAQPIDGLAQQIERFVWILVDQCQIEILFVQPLHSSTLVNGHLKVFVLVEFGQTLHGSSTTRTAEGTVELEG